MTSFVVINVGDSVYDRIQSIEGVVKAINYKTNVAELVTGSPSQDEVILSKLFNLTVLDKNNKPKHDYNKWYEQVKEFHKAFDHPIADKPTPITLERMINRKTWEFEEGIEALHASSSNVEEFNKAVDNVIKGIEKARQKSLQEEFPQNDLDRIVAQGDALTDGTYFLQGDFVELGLKPDSLFDIVQNSNMSKLFTDENGKKYAKYRESDSKILKSPEFFPPEAKLKAEIERQSK